MLSRSPADRPKFDHILSSFRGTIFPEYFYTFLQDYTSSLNELAPSSGPAYFENAALKPGNKIDRLREEWDSILIHLEGTAPEDNPAEGKSTSLLSSRYSTRVWKRTHGRKIDRYRFLFHQN